MSELTQINKLKEQGFTHSYKLIDDELLDLNTKKSFSPPQVSIEEEIRFEGMSNPGDMSILYAIKTEDGNKGTMLVAYGPGSNLDLHQFMKRVENLIA